MFKVECVEPFEIKLRFPAEKVGYFPQYWMWLQ